MCLDRMKFTCCYANVLASHLKAKLVEEVVEEVLNAAKHAIIQVTPRDVVKQSAGRGRDYFMSETVKLLVSVNCYLKG